MEALATTDRRKPCHHLGEKRCVRWNNGKGEQLHGCNHRSHPVASEAICAACPDYIGPGEAVRKIPVPISLPMLLKLEEAPPVNAAQATYPVNPGKDAGRREKRKWRGKMRENKVSPGGRRAIYEATPDMMTDRSGRIGGFAGLYYGADLYLLLGGPSTKELELDNLNKRGVVSMAVNNAALTHRTNLFICGDPPKKFHDAIWRDPGIVCFCPKNKLWNEMFEKRKDGRIGVANEQIHFQPGVVGYERNDCFNPESFLTEPTVSFGNSKKYDNEWPPVLSTMFSALKVAWWLGFFRVYLLGCDWKWDYHKSPYSFETTRAVNVYASNNHSYSKMAPMLRALKPVFDAANFEVYNCNPESLLTVFPHVPFDKAIESTVSKIPTDLSGQDWYGKDWDDGNFNNGEEND